jgi:hypothetical protein
MRFHVLDGWRGVAALLVALERLHAHGVFYSLPIIRHGYLFVDFFFVLSGFVVAHAYLDRLKDGTSGVGFAIRRFGRLWPLHVAVLGLFVLVEFLRLALGVGAPGEAAPFTGDNSLGALVANLFLVHALGLYDGLTWNMPSWSISTEFWTYMVFALVALLGRAHLLAIAAAIVLVSLAIVGAYSPKAMDTTFDVAIFRCLAGFFVGVATYMAFRRFHAATEATVGARAHLLEAAVLVGAYLFITLAGRSLASLAAPVVFAAVVYVFAFEKGFVSRAMSNRLFEALGAWSYSIYMTAFLVVLMVERAVNVAGRYLGGSFWRTVDFGEVERRLMVFPWPGAAEAIALVYLAMILVLSALLYRFVEVPARRFFNGVAERVERVDARRRRVVPAE